MQLKVQIHDLRAIRAQCSNDLGDCLLEMLSCWLSNTIPAPTWQTLVDALCCTAVGKQQVADKIRKEYLSGMLHPIFMQLYMHAGTCICIHLAMEVGVVE